jgi:hypothetical protein
MPIGNDRNLTPPASMLQYFRFGGENITLKKLLATLGNISGRKSDRYSRSYLSRASRNAAGVEFIINPATHRPPPATVEGCAHCVVVEAAVDWKNRVVNLATHRARLRQH